MKKCKNKDMDRTPRINPDGAEASNPFGHEKGKDIDEQASKVIIQDIYVDDGVSGGKDDDVQRMVGEMDADGKYKGGTISKILQLGNFNVKEYLVSSNALSNSADENGEMSKSLLGNAVLGYKWDNKKDLLAIR